MKKKEIIENLQNTISILTKERDDAKEANTTLKERNRNIENGIIFATAIQRAAENALCDITKQNTKLLKEIKDLEQRNCDLLNANKELEERYNIRQKEELTKLTYTNKQSYNNGFDDGVNTAKEELDDLKKQLGLAVIVREELRLAKNTIAEFRKLLINKPFCGKSYKAGYDDGKVGYEKLKEENTKLTTINKALQRRVAAYMIMLNSAFGFKQEVKEVNPCTDCTETSCPIHPSKDNNI